MAEEVPSALVLKQLNAVFWKNKKAVVEAELDQKMRELEEYQMREQALFETLSTTAISAAAPPAGALGAAAGAGMMEEMSALMAELSAEKARSAALEAELLVVQVQKEVELQKTAAFWIEKLAAAKEGSPAAAAAAAEPAAEPAASGHSAEQAGDIAPFLSESLLEEGLTVHELRSRLLGYGLSTTGIKAELRARLEDAMLHFRAQHKTWDTEKMVWTPPQTRTASAPSPRTLVRGTGRQDCAFP
eukprot:scaffold85229_cov63-Phaeocystis_antarctica.AAC.2